MREYNQVRKKVSAVGKRWYKIQEGGTTLEWDKVLTDASSALEDEERAIARLQEIVNRLRELSQSKIE